MGAHIEEVNQIGKRIYALAATLVVACAVLVGVSAGAGGTPGVTSSLISIGGTYPLSGPASSYGTIASAVAAYFSYFNSLRQPGGKRGVFGRQIKFAFLDDGYNPAQTVQLTRQLVEQTKVFAVFNGLGTEPSEAVRAYLNQAKVPQVFVATGASEWGALAKKYPWTIGYQPTYVSEAYAYGQFIAKKVSQAKIGVLFQNDSYGKDYIAGLKLGLGAKQSQIVDTEGYEVTAADVGSQMAKLKASGANTLCIFATPKFSIQAFAIAAKLGWNPIIFNNSVSATATLMGLATKSSSAQTTNGTITATYTEGPGRPEVGQRRGDEALPEDHGRVLPQGKRHRPVQRLRHVRGVDDDQGAPGGRPEPDPRVADGRGSEPQLQRQPVPAPGDQGADGARTTRSRSTSSSSHAGRTGSGSTSGR